MSSERIAMRAAGLSKCYQIYDRPQDRLKQSVVPRIRRLLGQTAPSYYREFWALRDVSFELRQGETLGIVGRNGSGKSTLLQIVCGTLAPTFGSVATAGRVAALLELGSGFNPEFTGRENVYLNASILGLARSEIDERFERIAGFADIGQFIDQPVKTYSSGMYVRLAFAVIAHVDADLLVVDEALAVGDAVFTQKCMRFIRGFQERGALLLVSHDMGTVVNLCQRAVWLGDGEVRAIGPAKEISEAYLQDTLQATYGDSVSLRSVRAEGAAESAESSVGASRLPPIDPGVRVSVDDNLTRASGWKTGAAELLSVAMDKMEPGPAGVFLGGELVRLTVRAVAHSALKRPVLGFLVRDRLGQDLFGENTLVFTDLHPLAVAAGQRFCANFVFRLPLLPNGSYAIMASVADGDAHDHVQHHWLHDALIVAVASDRRRYGLVGIPFEQVTLERCA